MHRVTATVGVAFAMLYIAAFASLSEITTVPAANVLPGFTVVAEKAEYVPTPATVPITPTRRSDRSAFRPRLMRWILLMVPSLFRFVPLGPAEGVPGGSLARPARLLPRRSTGSAPPT